MTDSNKEHVKEDPQENATASSSADSGPSQKGAKNAMFLAVIGGILGLFFFLSSFDGPPHLPTDANHRLKFNLDGDLLGLEIMNEENGTDENGEPLKKDKKSIERRTNLQCATCHGTSGIDTDLTNHPCHQLSKRCLPDTHPPKSTCIKCHRSGKGATHVLSANEFKKTEAPKTPNPQLLKMASDEPSPAVDTSDSGFKAAEPDGGARDQKDAGGPS
jgi:hypothetical protein